MSGNLIGLNSSTLGRAGQLTVLAATIDATVATLLQHGRVRRGYLGVGAQGVRLPETLLEPSIMVRNWDCSSSPSKPAVPPTRPG